MVEITVVMAVGLILFSVTIFLYSGYLERATRQICHVNCVQLEGMYNAYLLMENKAHTAYVFADFLQQHEGSICPSNGEIKYLNGKIRCSLHYAGEANGINDDEDGGNVPFL